MTARRFFSLAALAVLIGIPGSWVAAYVSGGQVNNPSFTGTAVFNGHIQMTGASARQLQFWGPNTTASPGEIKFRDSTGEIGGITAYPTGSGPIRLEIYANDYNSTENSWLRFMGRDLPNSKAVHISSGAALVVGGTVTVRGGGGTTYSIHSSSGVRFEAGPLRFPDGTLQWTADTGGAGGAATGTHTDGGNASFARIVADAIVSTGTGALGGVKAAHFTAVGDSYGGGVTYWSPSAGVSQHNVNTGGVFRFSEAAVTIAELYATGLSIFTSSFNVKSTGRVGIGTGSPAALVHGTSGQLLLDGNHSKPLQIQSGAGVSTASVDSAGNSFFRGSGTVLGVQVAEGGFKGPHFTALGSSYGGGVAYVAPGSVDLAMNAGSGGTIQLYSAANPRILISDTGVVFNNNAVGTVDLRVKGDTNEYLIFADASADVVGIGLDSPCSTCTLHVAGAVNATGAMRQGVALNCSTGASTDANGKFDGCVVSSRKAKTSIRPRRPELAAFDKLRSVDYTLRRDRAATPRFGFISEEVAALYPEVIVPSGDLTTIDPLAMSALIVAEVQDLRARVAALEKRAPGSPSPAKPSPAGGAGPLAAAIAAGAAAGALAGKRKK